MFNRALLEPASFVKERKMLLGIKLRAEGATQKQRRREDYPAEGSRYLVGSIWRALLKRLK
jgi:hypothetical protein